MSDEIKRDFVDLDIAVLTISDTRTEENDKSGKHTVQSLADCRHNVHAKAIVPDDKYRTGLLFHVDCTRQADVILIPGAPVLYGGMVRPKRYNPADKELPLLARFRVLSFETIATSTAAIPGICRSG